MVFDVFRIGYDCVWCLLLMCKWDIWGFEGRLHLNFGIVSTEIIFCSRCSINPENTNITKDKVD